MIDKEIEKFEIREKALNARDKEARARRMAARAANSPSTRALEVHAAEFEAKGPALDCDIEKIEERGPLDAGSVRDRASARARGWGALGRKKSEQLQNS